LVSDNGASVEEEEQEDATAEKKPPLAQKAAPSQLGSVHHQQQQAQTATSAFSNYNFFDHNFSAKNFQLTENFRLFAKLD